MESTGRRTDHVLRRLRAAVKSVLTGRERKDLVAIISQYRTTRNMADMTDALWALLDTPAKRRIVPLLEMVIPAEHRAEFRRRLADEPLQAVTTRFTELLLLSTFFGRLLVCEIQVK